MNFFCPLQENPYFFNNPNFIIMQKEFLTRQFPVTNEFRNKVWRYILELEELQGEFSDFCRAHISVRFTEYSFLYHDLYHFHENDLMLRKTYQPKDLVSFRNSAAYLFKRFNSYYTNRQNPLENYFMRLGLVFEQQIEILQKFNVES